MIINHNLPSMNTDRQLGINNFNTAKSLEKLSSGLRINRAGDDAAGLAISEKMRAQVRGLDQASRNAQDGISLISTAEGALNETHSILQRMRELSVQSANDTSTSSDRSEMQKEVVQLKSEVDRIGNTTEFNTKTLLDGGVGVSLSSSVAELKGTNTTAATKTGVYAVAVTAAATQAKIAVPANNFTAGTAGTLTLNGTNVSVATTDSIGDVAAKINNVSASTGVTAVIMQGTDATHQQMVLQSNNYGSSATIGLSASSTALMTAVGYGATLTLSAAGTNIVGTVEGAAATGDGLKLTSTGTNSAGLDVTAIATQTAATTSGTYAAAGAGDVLTINGKALTAFAAGLTIAQATDLINVETKDTGVVASYSGTTLTLTSVAQGDNAKITLSATGAGDLGLTAGTYSGSDGMTTSTGNVTVNKDNVLKMHIGANKDQNMEVSINDMRSSALGIDNLDVTTQAGANVAISTISDAIQNVSSERSKLGAYTNRLEHTIANLGTSSENMSSAESRIRDVDMAKEMMQFQKNNILSQAATAMLAQANQQPQGVLQLLR